VVSCIPGKKKTRHEARRPERMKSIGNAVAALRQNRLMTR
jgi:hypothetical protein